MTEIKPKNHPHAHRELHAAEFLVSQCLRVGVLLSATVIITGLVLFLLSGKSGYADQSYPLTLRDIITGTWNLKPFAILSTGLILLIFTPIMRVGASIFVFLKENDRLYAGISSLVFLIIIGSLFLGKSL